MMEKYGVDQKNDEFEKEAQGMVKTGNANNINDARETLANKTEDKKTKK